MQASQLYWKDLEGWADDAEQPNRGRLVLYFGSREMLADEAHYTALKQPLSGAPILLGCSTGGQMAERRRQRPGADRAGAAISPTRRCKLARSRGRATRPVARRRRGDRRRARGARPRRGVHPVGWPARQRQRAGRGRRRARSAGDVPVSGGLAGDGAAFAETLVGCNGQPRERHGRGGRLLRRRHPLRPRQRRRLGRVRAQAQDHQVDRQRAARGRRQAGARSLQALSRARGEPEAAGLGAAVSDAHLRSAASRADRWCAPCSRSMPRPAR